jgi:hypothetical protein
MGSGIGTSGWIFFSLLLFRQQFFTKIIAKLARVGNFPDGELLYLKLVFQLADSAVRDPGGGGPNGGRRLQERPSSRGEMRPGKQVPAASVTGPNSQCMDDVSPNSVSLNEMSRTFCPLDNVCPLDYVTIEYCVPWTCRP